MFHLMGSAIFGYSKHFSTTFTTTRATVSLLHTIKNCLQGSRDNSNHQSASAERAMNKVKLIKARFRSVMSDDYFSAPMLIASEKDIADSIAYDNVTNRLARCFTSTE
jgi:hypothetical protein